MTWVVAYGLSLVHRRADPGSLMKLAIRLFAAIVSVLSVIMAIATFPLGAANVASLMRPAVCLIVAAGAAYFAVTGRSIRFD